MGAKSCLQIDVECGMIAMKTWKGEGVGGEWMMRNYLIGTIISFR